MTADKKLKLEELLKNSFSSVYCDTCNSYNRDDNDPEYCCDDCIRKSMYWSISDKYAEQLADKILNCIKEVEMQELKERYDECLEVLNRGIDYYR